jgi:hypothetical protein
MRILQLGGAASEPQPAPLARRQVPAAGGAVRIEAVAAVRGPAVQLARDREEALAPAGAVIGREAVGHLTHLGESLDDGGEFVQAAERRVAMFNAVVATMGAKKARDTRMANVMAGSVGWLRCSMGPL